MASLSELELDSGIVFREEGTLDKTQLFEVDFEPQAVIHQHAHELDEIIYVLEESMKVGNRVLGASIAVAGGTFYGLEVGAEGLRMLNFRPQVDMTYIAPSRR